MVSTQSKDAEPEAPREHFAKSEAKSSQLTQTYLLWTSTIASIVVAVVLSFRLFSDSESEFLEAKFETIGAKFGIIEVQLQAANQKLDKIDDRLTHLERMYMKNEVGFRRPVGH